MNDSTAKVDWSRMSLAQKARSLGGCHVTRAASIGVVPPSAGRKYYERAGLDGPDAQPVERKADKVPLESIERHAAGWTLEMDRTLLRMKRRHAGKREIARAVNRSPSAVDARFQKLQDMDCV